MKKAFVVAIMLVAVVGVALAHGGHEPVALFTDAEVEMTTLKIQSRNPEQIGSLLYFEGWPNEDWGPCSIELYYLIKDMVCGGDDLATQIIARYGVEIEGGFCN